MKISPLVNAVMSFSLLLKPLSLLAKPLSSQIEIPIKKYKLKNGLTALLNSNPNTTMSSYYLGFATGSRHERKGITGMSHMFEHLMFKGTKKYPNISKLYSQHGIVGMNAMTSKDYTVYIAEFIKDKLVNAVTSFSSLLKPLSLLAKPLSSQIEIPIKKYKLKNGLTVLLNSNPNTTMSSYYLGFATGSRHERKGITGISHMFEHLMFKGTEKYPNISKLYSQHGIVGMNAMTSKDYTVYIAEFIKDKLELVLDVESNRMSGLTLTQEDLDKERKAVQEERRLRVDNQPRGMLFEALYETVFKKHSYHWPVIGYEKDIANYSLKDLKEWYGTHYSPNNATLVLSGNFSEKEARRLIAKYFGPLIAKKIPEEKNIIEPMQTEARSFVLKKPVQTKMAFLAYRFPGQREKDVLALEVASDLLGTGESSRLYKALVRDQKIVSSISCFVLNHNKHSLLLVYYSLPKNSSEEKVKEAIYNEINKIATEPIEKKEIEKIKNIRLMEFINQLKRSSSRAHLLGLYEVSFNGYENIHKDFDQLNNLSSEFIQKTVQKYLTPQQSSYLILKPEGN